MRKSDIVTGSPSPCTPTSPAARWLGWLGRRCARWLRFSAGLYIALAFAAGLAAQDDRPRERVRFLDGKTELCEVVSADADGVVLKLEGLPKPVRFRWWQLAPEDASRLREAWGEKPMPATPGAITVPGLRVRTLDGKTYEGVAAPGAPAGELWVQTAEGKFVLRSETIVEREEIRIEIQRAYSPEDVVAFLSNRLQPSTADDYDRLGAELLKARLQSRAVAAFRMAELLRHPELPEGRLVAELARLKVRIGDLAVRRGIFQAEERALAGDYDAALAELGAVDQALSGLPDAGPLVEELRRVRSHLEAFRAMAREDRLVSEGYRALEAMLKAKAMDRAASYGDARSWAEDRLMNDLVEHLRGTLNFSPEDPMVRRLWDRRPQDLRLKHGYGDASWVFLRPELRPVDAWWSGAADAARYALLKGVFIEKHLHVVRAEPKSCGTCGGIGQIEGKGGVELCAECQGLKATRVLIYR